MAATIDQQFIEFIVKALVGNPDAVRVERTIDEKGVLLELYVDPTDLGRVIGRNGTTAKSIRILLRALGVKNDARYNLKIVDTNGGGRREREDYDRQPSQTNEQVQAEAAGEQTSREPIEQPALDENSNAEADTITRTPNEDLPPHTKKEDEEAETDSLARHREQIKDITGDDLDDI